MANAANNSKNDVIIYPIHTLDNAREYRKLFMSYIFRFNSVLDGQKLADALSKLLETNDWKKLGGRLHVNVRALILTPKTRHFKLMAANLYAGTVERRQTRDPCCAARDTAINARGIFPATG